MGSTRLSYARTQYPMGNGKPMPNVRQQEMARGPGRVSAVALAVLVWTAAAQAADCPRKGTLGTSRVMAVDPTVWPRIGRRDFAQTLSLGDHEVVLTFDDGPWPATTPRVLRTLAKECVRATFFLIGRPASEFPWIVRAAAADGHSLGHHTWMHFSLRRMPYADAVAEIDHGISAVEMAERGIETTTPSTPFFRFPGFESTPATLDLLQSRGISVFSTDLLANDWVRMTPRQELDLLVKRLKLRNRGIILLHDSQATTAAMLPALLQYLRKHRYRVVHLVAASAAGEPEASPR
jgi:peptidoglycan/xylan/chitin deacetylase (PgdA/CDA1 family)